MASLLTRSITSTLLSSGLKPDPHATRAHTASTNQNHHIHQSNPLQIGNPKISTLESVPAPQLTKSAVATSGDLLQNHGGKRRKDRRRIWDGIALAALAAGKQGAGGWAIR